MATDVKKPTTAYEYGMLMLERLVNATRNVADRVRKEEKAPAAMTTTELFVATGDYLTQKMARPPLLSVERNLVMMHRNERRMARTIKRLHALVYEVAKSCGSSAMDSRRCVDPPFAGNPSHDSCDDVLATRLVKVQGNRFSVIGMRTEDTDD
jgi:hypothetical protein